ncbi:glycosyltransferase family 90 protein, partial [Zopfia rhizophila CBS 207.26]
HPVDRLIAAAEIEFAKTVKRESKTVNDAARAYRKRRRRHPPPGFEAWYNYAAEHGALIIEDFWDQIYHDLGPFWGVPPFTLRQQAHAIHPNISIRNGKVVNGGEHAWAVMIEELARAVKKWNGDGLPDMDIPININAEPAIIVSWETIDTALSLARPIIPPATDVVTDFSGLGDFAAVNDTFEPEWLGPRLTHPSNSRGPRPYWSLVRPACHPKSPARGQMTFNDIWHIHTFPGHEAVNLLPSGFPNGTKRSGGFVGNWTKVGDLCGRTELQGLHGGFVRPEGMAASAKLFPLFAGSKFAVNNDILLPSVGDWNSSHFSPYSSSPSREGERKPRLAYTPWKEKEDKLYWRGPATGGHNTEKNWNRFHRHRFVSMLNASQISIAESDSSDPNSSVTGIGPAGNFRLPPGNPYRLHPLDMHSLAKWVESWADVAFTDLRCDELQDDCGCSYNGEFYGVKSAEEEKEVGKYKYTAVLDGNGGDDGGELSRKLKTGSTVLRASVYRQWYDARLVPWLHYVPVDNTFADLWGVMQYFLTLSTPPGVGKNAGKHDDAARRIGQAGKAWADRVLRKEDTLIYVYRLLLEYVRVVDDRRERLGWVGD